MNNVSLSVALDSMMNGGYKAKRANWTLYFTRDPETGMLVAEGNKDELFCPTPHDLIAMDYEVLPIKKRPCS